MNATTILLTLSDRLISLLDGGQNYLNDSEDKVKILKLDIHFPFKSIELKIINGKKYIIKTIYHRFENLYVKQLRNENHFLNALNSLASKIGSNIPSESNLTTMIGKTQTFQSYVNGTELSKYNSRKILYGFDKATKILNNNWIKLDRKTKESLPTVNPTNLNWTFPIYLLISLLKSGKNYKKILQLGLVYFRCGKFETNDMTRQTIAHRDLTPENIIVGNNNKINIIDFEVASVADKLTDLALFPRFYIDYLDEKLIINYLTSKITNAKDKIQFIKLTIFYTLQFMTIENINSRYFNESIKYLDLLLFKILPKFDVGTNTIAEILYFYFLNFIGNLNSKYETASNAILCYHSIDNSNWRFSTPVKEFEKQLKYLKSKFKIVSLDEIIDKANNKTNNLSITFDDGYEDVYVNAFPIMKRMKIVGTVFVVGDTKKSNKMVLGNHKKMLSVKQINELSKSGWTIGYHTKTHSSLRNISKLKIDNEIKSKYKYFAYPNGYYDNNIIRQIVNSGYIKAFTVDGGGLVLDNDFKINRIPMEGKLTVDQLKNLLTPIGLSFSTFFMKLLKFKEYRLKPILKS